jgi:hypothetical protein
MSQQKQTPSQGSKNKAAVLSSLTFFLGQLETLKADLNDIIRYTKQNAWEDSNAGEEPSPAESPKGEEETEQ